MIPVLLVVCKTLLVPMVMILNLIYKVAMMLYRTLLVHCCIGISVPEGLITKMALTHNHFCKHCESLVYCQDDSCNIPSVRQKSNGIDYDDKFIHDCGERERYNRRIKRLLSDYPACKYGCNRLPCQHDLFAEKDRIKGRYFNEFVRPMVKPVEMPVYDLPIVKNGIHDDNCICRKCVMEFRR